MDYTCQHCGANLDDGDIFERFLLKYGDPVKARDCASSYGWFSISFLPCYNLDIRFCCKP